MGWIHALGVPAQVHTPLSVTTMLAFALPGTQAVGLAVAAAAVCWIALRCPTGSPSDALRAAALALTVTLLLSPVVHPWYALWCIPLVAACRLRRRGLAVLVWLSFVLGMSAPLDSSLEGAYVAIVLTSTLVIGVVVALTWANRPSAHPAIPLERSSAHG